MLTEIWVGFQDPEKLIPDPDPGVKKASGPRIRIRHIDFRFSFKSAG
jgi:hypothetical protein